MGCAYNRGFHSLSYDPTGALTGYQSDDYTEKDILYLDLGGDWDHKFSPESSLKLVSVNSLVSWRPQEYFAVFDPSGVILGATSLNTDNKRGEHVLRGVWTQRFGTSDTLELGVEAAYNYRDTVRAIADSTAGGPFIPRNLPIATTKVEEDRFEAFVNNTWRASPQLTLEAGFNYEVSTITQSGDAQQERDFKYPKPHIVGTWTPTKADQVRLSLERAVAQLDFAEFASNVSLTQNNQLTVGNPNLEPEQFWSTQLVWKHSIGQRGSVSLTLGYDAIDDVQDLIPIRPDPNSTACQLNFNGRGCVFTRQRRREGRSAEIRWGHGRQPRHRSDHRADAPAGHVFHL
jgi:outer membrane receptor protein involved in Fe transport